MAAGEYAVLYSSTPPGLSSQLDGVSSGGPFCTVFGTLDEAVDHAMQQIALLPALRCRIYDHYGLGHEPLREIRGGEHKGESEISARFRRWAGSLLFFGGLGLVLVDWSHNFELSWPAMVGFRMMPVGLVLLVTEGVIVFDARRKQRRERDAG